MVSSIKDQYPYFSQSIKEKFNNITQNKTPLFTTNTEELFNAYLNNLPEEIRQEYNCKTCKHFIETYGSLVTITENGEIESAVWDEEKAPELFKESVKEMRKIVLNSSITGVFISEKSTLGQPVKGGFDHLSLTIPKEMIHQSKIISSSQAMAEKQEEHRILENSLSIYPQEAVEQAVTLLKTESLYRSEKCLGVGEWLMNLHIKRSNSKNHKIINNVTWLAVATAPVGYCHVKTSMIGTLLDDIVSGLPFDIVSKRFAQKMDPLKYQRPQALPTAGNIAQAEKIVEKLGIQKSLVRRFARVEELVTQWTPKEENIIKKEEGTFSHLKSKEKSGINKMEMPSVVMTWRKFSETVLPIAEKIEFFVRDKRENYSAILTAEHDDAPPIIQWDNEEERNPFSWYVYSGGSTYTRWGLTLGYCNVTAVCLQPSMWYKENSHHGKSVFFILEGCKDTGYKNIGNSLFPENLKSELREIRSTIEAYSKNASVEGYENSTACGIKLEHGSTWNATFRVTTKTGIFIYKLDRWD
ncbi:MAG: hypothetical protein ACRC2K_10645 [Clostridium sp.]